MPPRVLLGNSWHSHRGNEEGLRKGLFSKAISFTCQGHQGAEPVAQGNLGMQPILKASLPGHGTRWKVEKYVWRSKNNEHIQESWCPSID